MKKYKKYAVYLHRTRKEILERYDVAVVVFKLFCNKYSSDVRIVLLEGEELHPRNVVYHETKCLLHRCAQRKEK